MGKEVKPINSQDQTSFWQSMQNEKFSWDEKKRLLKNNMDQLPNLIRNDDDLVNLFNTLSKDKIEAVLNHPNMKETLSRFFSSDAALKILASTDPEKVNIFLQHMKPHLKAGNAIVVVSKYVDPKERLQFISSLSGACKKELTTATNLLSLSTETNDSDLLGPFLLDFINALINKGLPARAQHMLHSLKQAGKDPIKIDQVLKQHLTAFAVLEAKETLGKREFTQKEEVQYKALSASTDTKSLDPAKIKETLMTQVIGATLGLPGEQHIGLDLRPAMNITKRRFEQFKGEKQPTLNLRAVTEVKDDFLNADCVMNGDYEGVEASWANHAFSFHVIKEGNQTHLIYLNRGQQAFEKAEDDAESSTVNVYTFNKGQEDLMLATSQGLHKALLSKDRKTIADYMTHHLPERNDELSNVFNKSHQKVGNCTIANANLSWHFTLASQAMKADPKLSLKDAYIQTTPNYKAMRDQDRATSFVNLCQQGDKLYPNENEYHSALYQTMYKALHKDTLKPERRLMDLMITKLASENKPKLMELFKTIASPEFSQNMESEDIKVFTTEYDGYHTMDDKKSIQLVNDEVQLRWMTKIFNTLSEQDKKTLTSDYQEKLIAFADNISYVDFDEHWPIIKETPQLIPHLSSATIEKMLVLPETEVDRSLVQAITLEQVQKIANRINSPKPKSYLQDFNRALPLIERLPQLIPHLSSDVIEKILEEAPDTKAAQACIDHMSEEQVRNIIKTVHFDVAPFKSLLEKYPQTIKDLHHSMLTQLLTSPDVNPDIRQVWIENLSQEQLTTVFSGGYNPELASSIFTHHPSSIDHDRAKWWLKDTLKHNNENQVKDAITILIKRPDLMSETPKTVLDSILKQEDAPDTLKQRITDHQKNVEMEQEQAQKTRAPPPITPHTESTTAATDPTADYRHELEALREKDNIPTQSPHPPAAMTDTVSLAPVENSTQPTAPEKQPSTNTGNLAPLESTTITTDPKEQSRADDFDLIDHKETQDILAAYDHHEKLKTPEIIEEDGWVNIQSPTKK
ncbi:MAG: hypothetical protein NTW08_01515 [Gammaproteobacteria bacterium]|nr:hypothetical protein [Gammaproteobacteria bacterium]